MNDSSMFHKFPTGSADRDYDIFEEFPDGSTVWRGTVFGMHNVEAKLVELSRGSGNKLFALSLQDGTNTVIHLRQGGRPSAGQLKRTA